MANDLFFISKANPLHWRIDVDPNTLTQDPNYPPIMHDMNFLAEDLVEGDGMCYLVPEKLQCQQFLCEDQTNLQFYHLISGYSPWLFWYYPTAPGGIPVLQLAKTPAQMNIVGSSDTHAAMLTMSDYDCNECFQFALFSIADDVAAPPPANLFTDGDNGTMEAGITGCATGGNLGNQNSIAHSNAQAHSGTWSALVTGNNHNNKNRLIMNGTTTIGLVANTVYYAEAWVYFPVGNAIIASDTLGFDITINGGFSSLIGSDKGWTDAVILSEQRCVFNAVGWQKITATFMVNTDTQGHLCILADKIPVNGGEVYIDDVSLRIIDTNRMATSERICVQETMCNSIGVTYGATPGEEHPQFWLNYSDSIPIVSTFFIRIPNVVWWHFAMVDDDYIMSEESENNDGKVVLSRLTKVNKFRAGQLPWWMMEKLPMIMKHDYVKIQLHSLAISSGNPATAVEYVAMKGGFNPKWSEDEKGRMLAGSVEWEMRPKAYDYQNSDCGPQ